MSYLLHRACVLTLAALLSTSALAEENPKSSQDLKVSDLNGSQEELDPNVLLTGWDGCDACGECGPCDCQGSCNSGCNLGCGSGGPCSRSQFFVGAEYLSVRTSFSEAISYLDRNLQTNTYSLEQFNFDYGDSFRVYAGMRLCECGGEIRFTYTDIDTGGSFDSGQLDTASGTRLFIAPFEVTTITDGDRLVGDASTSIENYDLAFAKTIPLGTPFDCCDCSDACCGTCCPRPCAAWDITWSGAVRAANYNSRLGWQSILVTGQPRTAESVVQFDGVGLRTGLLGRRYFGRKGIASLYLKGDISLLLGEVDYYVQGTAIGRVEETTTEVIPVTELEVGGSIYLTSCITASGGYMLAAWHDLGHRAQSDFATAGLPILGMDDANMMMLDGYFARIEATY